MARRRSESVAFPESVQIVVKKATGRKYYYWAPKRGTKNAGERTPLGSDPTHPNFWAKIRELQGAPTVGAGTFDALITEYRGTKPDFIGCPDWNRLRPASKTDYNIYLNRISNFAGDRLVAALTKQDVYRWRDRELADTPASANHQISILRTLIEFGISRGYRQDNPLVGLKPLKRDEGGHRPWPEKGWQFVIDNAPPDLMRMAFLGRATGQRAADLVRIRPADRQADGFNLRISKLRGKEHFQVLTQTEIIVIDSWEVEPMDLYLKSVRKKVYTPRKLNTRWGLWRATEEAKPVRDLKMTIHGLRATAVCDRRQKGAEHQEIANELCMSIQMVMRYSRFMDQPTAARASRDRRERNGTSI